MTRKNKLFSKYNLSLLLKLSITAVAYIYIYYRVADAFKQTGNFNLVKELNATKYILIITCLLLMIVNWLLESYKWKYLLHQIEKISIKLSVKSVLIGLTYSVFTPYRLGEYFGRPAVLQKANRARAFFANIWGSISQNMVTISAGIIGLILLVRIQKQILFSTSGMMLLIGSLILFISILFTLYFFPTIVLNISKKTTLFRKYTTKLEFLSAYQTTQLLQILLLAAARYIVFFLQYYLLLEFYDIEIDIVDAFSAISLSYVFLFSIPGIPIADIGVRGSLALFFLGIFSDKSIAIIAASSSLWIINLAIPSLLGSFVLIRIKNQQESD